jgi:hypothetical protein
VSLWYTARDDRTQQPIIARLYQNELTPFQLLLAQEMDAAASMGHGLTFYDKLGRRISLGEFSALKQDRAYVIVARTNSMVAEVSTIWLGMPAGVSDGPVGIFETMILSGEYTYRGCKWNTLEEAQRGHERVMENLRRGDDPFTGFDGF